jgi:outer membrane protein, adhesin transport system
MGFSRNMARHFRSFISGLGLAVVTAASAVAPAAAAQLERELANLLYDHPQIRSALKSVESARREITKTKSGYYPTVSATTETGHELIDSPTERNSTDGQDGKPSSRTPYATSLTVTQNLFNGFLTDSQTRTARLNKEISQFNLETTKQNTLFAGANTYIDVLRQQRLVELSRENEATIQRQLNLEDERVQRGSGVAVDVLQAKSRLQIAKERRVNFEGALADAASRYIQTFGHAPNIDAMTDPVPPVEMIPSTLDRAVEIAVIENPAASSAITSIEVARQQRRTVMSELAPTVDLEGQDNYEKHSGATIGTRRDYSLMVTANWDLFSGFSTRESLSQATFDYRASQDNRDDTARRVIEQTRLAWQALLTARERLGLLENAVNIASEVFESRKRLREAGKETVINVLDAENEVSNAQINYTSAAYDERLAVYQLLRAMGRLNIANLGLEPS